MKKYYFTLFLSFLITVAYSQEGKKDYTEGETNKKDLQEYVGYYSSIPWGGEEFISTWSGKLVSIALPSESPTSKKLMPLKRPFIKILNCNTGINGK